MQKGVLCWRLYKTLQKSQCTGRSIDQHANVLRFQLRRSHLSRSRTMSWTRIPSAILRVKFTAASSSSRDASHRSEEMFVVRTEEDSRVCCLNPSITSRRFGFCQQRLGWWCARLTWHTRPGPRRGASAAADAFENIPEVLARAVCAARA